MYIVTVRWHINDLEVAKEQSEKGHAWFKGKAESTQALVMTTGEMVGDVLFIMRYSDMGTAAKVIDEWRATKEYKELLSTMKEADNIMQEIVHYRSLE